MTNEELLNTLYAYVQEKRAAHGKHSGTEREQGNWDMASCIEGKILIMRGVLRNEADARKNLTFSLSSDDDRWGDVMDISAR